MDSTRRTRGRGLGLLLLLGLASVFLVFPVAADADSGDWLLNEGDGSEAQVKDVLAGADEMLEPPAEEPLRGIREPYVGPKPEAGPNPKLDVPHPPWRYDTEYFFGLSRGVFKEHVPTGVKVVSLLGTVPLDLAGLPFAAIGGLFGS